MKVKNRERKIDYPVGSFHINHGRLLIDHAQSDADNYTLEIAHYQEEGCKCPDILCKLALHKCHNIPIRHSKPAEKMEMIYKE